MPRDRRVKLVVANGINMAVEINEVIIENARLGTDAEIQLPGLIDRAYMIFHETGTVPMVDFVVQETDNSGSAL